MKYSNNLFVWACTLLLFTHLSSQVQSFDISPSVGLSASIESPSFCQGFPLQICGAYTLDYNFPLTFTSLDVPDLDYSVDFVDEQTKTFCLTLFESNFIDVDCNDITVVLNFSNSSNFITSLTTNTINVCQSQINCECLYTNASNVNCYSNGTSEPDDDYWAFDLIVENTLNDNTSYSIEPLGITGYYGVEQIVLVGSIADNPTISISIIDTEFPDDCNIKLDLEAPEKCSSGCGLFVSTIIGECSDAGTENVLSDDVYDVEVDVSYGSLDTWEVYQIFTSDNTSTLVGSGVGNGKFVLEGIGIILGDWILSSKLVNDPTCSVLELIQAPANCSGFMDIVLTNTLCNNQDTPIEEDDTWSFDLLITGGIGDKFKIPEFGIQAPYGQEVTVEAGVISECLDLTIFDTENPMQCESIVVVCPPKTCSESGNDCDLIVEFGKKECVKIGSFSGFEQELNIQGTSDACWKVIKTDLNGQEEILVENQGDKNLKIGPFDLEDFNLRVELCDNVDCKVSEFVEAPDCPGFNDDDIITRNSTNIIYPNPIRSSEITLLLEEDVKGVLIYDAVGSYIGHVAPNTLISTYNIELRPGIHLFRLVKEDGSFEIIKVVRQ